MPRRPNRLLRRRFASASIALVIGVLVVLGANVGSASASTRSTSQARPEAANPGASTVDQSTSSKQSADDDDDDDDDEDGSTSTPEKPKSHKNISIKPFNDCYVKSSDGTVVSYFGYDLAGSKPATIPAGTPYNYLTGASANSGQPSKFTTGAHSLVFSVTWDANKPEPIWYLNGVGVSATASGKPCKEIPAVPEFPIALVGPVVALAAFGGWFLLRRRSLGGSATPA